MRTILISLGAVFFVPLAYADCISDGVSAQFVMLTVQGKQIDQWDAIPGQIHQTKLPSGFTVGIEIDPTTAEKYREVISRFRGRGVDELANIRLFDVSQTPSKLLSQTWGGSNSKQGFGPRGGANGVPELIDQVELWLHKPTCITEESLKKNRQ